MAGTPGTFRFPQINAKPSAPPVGYVLLYTKTDDVLYLQDSTGTEVAIGSASAITQLTGDVSASGPGIATATVNFVGGASAASIAASVSAFLSATSTNNPNTIVERDASGNFSAGIITATLNGNATTATSAGSATNFTGSLSGDVTGTQSATVVAFVGGASASAIATSVLATQNATSLNTPSTIVLRDASGNFSANVITAALHGNATTATTAITSTNFTGSLSGDVTGIQSATVVSFVGGESASAIATSVAATQNATPVNIASTIVERDATGNFAASVITASLTGNVTGDVLGNLTGNVTGNVSGSAASFTGSLAGDVTGTQSATSILSTVVTGKLLTGLATGTNTAILATDSILIALEKLQAQVSGTTGTAITSLTGDVTATGPGAAAATIAAIQGTVVSGTTGTIKAVFSNAPTFTGLLSGATASFSGNISALNLSGSNSGDVTILSSDSILLGLSGQQITASLKLSSDAADANNLKATTTIHTGAGAGLHVEYPFAIPVQIGTSNSIGAASSFSLSDHVHAHGNQTSPTLHAIATDLLNGFMSAADKTILDAATSLNTPSTIVERDASGNFAASAITANLTGNVTGNVSGSAASFTGSLSGDVTGTQGATAISSAIVTGKLLTGLATGTNTAILATDSILIAFEKLQAQVSAGSSSAITSLTGDVTATGPGAAAATITVGAVTDTKASLAGKPAVTVVATTNQSLTGTPTIDGQATTAGTSIVLLTAQSTGSQNGPWVVQSGAWTRPTWYPTGGTTQSFQFITTLVRLGTVYQGSVWRQTTAAPITIDTTATTWTVTPLSGNYKSAFQIGPATGSAEVDLTFANAFAATLAWNPTANFKLLLPPTQGGGGTYLSNDGAGNLSWSNPLVNIDGGTASSVYTTSQVINGGTP